MHKHNYFQIVATTGITIFLLSIVAALILLFIAVSTDTVLYAIIAVFIGFADIIIAITTMITIAIINLWRNL